MQITREIKEYEMCRSGARDRKRSAAFFAALHDRCMQALAQRCGHFVDLVRAVNLDGLPRGVQRDFAVLAAVKVLFEIGAHPRGHLIVDEVVEHREKLTAGHFSAPTAADAGLRLK